MSRVPPVGDDDAGEVVAAVFQNFHREGREPIALYRALANAPLMLRAYAGLAQGLRHEASTPRALRELVILRTAQLVGSDYEWSHHRVMAERAGVSEAQVRALGEDGGAGAHPEAFDERERAALRCADEVHEVALSEEGFAELQRALGTEGAIEIVLLAAFYQAVARVIQGLGVEVEPGYRPFLDRPR